MGAGQSGGLDIGGSCMGYQVLRVYPNSPGSCAGLKAYFDFIVAIGNTRFNKENGSLREILKASVDQKLKMVVYNTRTKSTREVEIVPTTSWGGNGLLGVSIKHSSFDRADERVWHVVDVEPGSPAQQAGFKANEDYVIGSDSVLQENDDLYNLVESHEGKALKLFVYNVATDNCREVICYPNSRWGGKGYLGCEFGHGLLHRIPYGNQVDVGADPRISVARSEQRVDDQTAHPQQQFHPLQRPVQPGQQLLQQALFDQKPLQSRQQTMPSVEKPPQQPSQAPQTFAQLASTQFQNPSSYNPLEHGPPSPFSLPPQISDQHQYQTSNIPYSMPHYYNQYPTPPIQAPYEQVSQSQMPSQQFIQDQTVPQSMHMQQEGPAQHESHQAPHQLPNQTNVNQVPTDADEPHSNTDSACKPSLLST